MPRKWESVFGTSNSYVRSRKRAFIYSRTVQSVPGTHPNSHLICSRILSLWLRWPGHEAENPTTNVAELKIQWCYTSTLSVCLPDVDRDEYYDEHACFK